MRRCWALTALIVVSSACASKPPPAPEQPLAQSSAQPIITPDVMPSWGRTHSQAAAKPKVQVRGIEGTLHNFDVKVTMEEHNAEFAACQASRPRKVSRLAGSMEFGIHVKHSGDVSDVDLRNSDVGDRALERCLIDVIRHVQFPRPNGGDANVTYTMLLGPEGKVREAEEWKPGRVQHLVAKHGEEVREKCSLPSGEVFTVTAYINGNGRVISAGVAGKAMSEVERFDCIAEKLSRWEMPKPTKKRLAKVTFPLRSSGRT